MPGGVLKVIENLIQKTLKENGKEVKIELFTLISEFDQLEIEVPGEKGEIYQVKIRETLPKWINQIFLFFKHKKIPFFSSIFDYRNLIVFYPQLMKLLSWKIKKWKPDQIQISSFAIAKNIDPIPWVRTSLYLHSPMQYIWSHHDEYLAKFQWWKKRLFQRIVPRLRKWDLKFNKFDEIVFNSKYTQKLAWELYGMRGKVDYPKVWEQYWISGISQNPKPYFVCVGRLVNFVRESERIIQLFNSLKLPLIMIGSGPDEEYLKSIAGENIIFTGWMKEGLAETIRDSSGLINLTKESFWIGTVEALLMWVPVFWFIEGATAELVDEECGILVKKKDILSLKSAFKNFLKKKWDRKLIANTIRKKII